MAGGSGRGKGERAIMYLGYYVGFCNILAWIFGVCIFSLALWIRFQSDFQSWVKELQMYQYWTGDYILLGGAIIVMIISFLGCCGVAMENACMLMTNVVMGVVSVILLLVGSVAQLILGLNSREDEEWITERFIDIKKRNEFYIDLLYFLRDVFVGLLSLTFLIELAGAAYMLNNGIGVSQLGRFLQDTFRGAVYTYGDNPRMTSIMRIMQEFVKCCGAQGAQDYNLVHKPVPIECRDPVTGNQWPNGCVKGFSAYLELKTGWICGLALVLCVLQITLIVAGIILVRNIKKSDRPSKGAY